MKVPGVAFVMLRPLTVKPVTSSLKVTVTRMLFALVGSLTLVLITTVGATVSLLVVVLMVPRLPAVSVWLALTVRLAPSLRLVTSRDVVKVPAVHAVLPFTLPTLTVTVPSLVVQVPLTG